MASVGPSKAYLEGTETFVASTNGGVEVEFPFYSNNLWVFAFMPNDALVPSVSPDLFENEFFRSFQVEMEISGAANNGDYLVTDFATAEDFCLLRYQGPPHYSSA